MTSFREITNFKVSSRFVSLFPPASSLKVLPRLLVRLFVAPLLLQCAI